MSSPAHSVGLGLARCVVRHEVPQPLSPGVPLRAASLRDRGRVLPFQPPPLRTVRAASRTRLTDPWLARDLTAAAAGNPETTWCVTVTDEHGHAIGHGCARPGPKNQARRRDKPDKPGLRSGPDPPPGTRDTPGPGFSLTASGQHGPPGGYGSWKLRTGASGQRDLLVALDPIATDECDHRYEAKGHDPGSSSGTCPRSGTRPVPGRPAEDPPHRRTLNTTPPTKQADGRACVTATAARSAAPTTGSSNTPAGTPISSPTGRSGGPPRLAANTLSSPPATPFDPARRTTAVRSHRIHDEDPARSRRPFRSAPRPARRHRRRTACA